MALAKEMMYEYAGVFFSIDGVETYSIACPDDNDASCFFLLANFVSHSHSLFWHLRGVGMSTWDHFGILVHRRCACLNKMGRFCTSFKLRLLFHISQTLDRSRIPELFS